MRRSLTLLHRWAGLFTAIFLAIAGLTGAVIAFEHELDEALNPELYRAASAGMGASRSPLSLADAFERMEPDALVTYLPLGAEEGHTLTAFVSPRADAQGKAASLDYNQVAFDPVTGEVQQRRLWGEASVDALHLMPFVYKLHYSLHLPFAGGIDTGALFMGIVAIVWFLDSFVALWISFPNRKVWRKSFAFRLRQGFAKLNFDLHRSGGVWLWAVLAVFALTAVSMNLGDHVVRPVVGLLSPLAPEPFHDPPARADDWDTLPLLSRADALALAQREADARDIAGPPGALYFNPDAGMYGVGFFEPGHDHADGSLGNPWLYFDARTGEAAGATLPGQGSAGDLFMQAQFPLHSGRWFGLAGRIAVAVLGVLITLLSVTGVVIWARKRRAKARAAAAKARGQVTESGMGMRGT